MKNILHYKLSIIFYGMDDKPSSYDYILNDIFANHSRIECDFILIGEEHQSDKIYDVFVYNCTDPNRISYFGYSPTYDQTKDAILKFKPKIIIQLADEFWIEHNEVHNLLANLCNLFLKQHRHKTQILSYSENLHIIPLGYGNGFLPKVNTIKPIKDRRYTWSWVGVLKTDRAQMINWFWSMWKNITICNAYTPINEIYDLYSESIFVPCGRGNSSLDCFRLYETTVSGAIPVVVGPLDEIDWTFEFFGEKPPWVYAESWKKALLKCQEIQFDYERLQEMQEENINWWNRMLNKIQNEILNALKSERVDYSRGYFKIEEAKNSLTQPQSVVFYYSEQKLPESDFIDGHSIQFRS